MKFRLRLRLRHHKLNAERTKLEKYHEQQLKHKLLNNQIKIETLFLLFKNKKRERERDRD